jgi:hypothetical protein
MKKNLFALDPRYKSLYIRCSLVVMVLYLSLACNALGAATTHPADTPDSNEIIPTEVGTNNTSVTPSALDATLEAMVARQASSLLGKPDPSANPKPITIVDQWFRVNPQSGNLEFIFIATNPNTDLGISSAPFMVNVYDKTGKSLTQPWNEELGPLFPGQTVAYSNTYSIPENSEVGKVEVQMGELVANQPGAQNFPLSVDQVKLITYAETMSVTGIIKNTLQSDIAWIDAVALAFDASGKLIGGSTYAGIHFIPGNGQVAVTQRLATNEKPARVELIPRLGNTSEIEPPSDEIKDIHIAGIGVRLGSANIADYTAIFENKSQEKVYLGLEYSFALYAEDGSVLTACEGDINTLFPNDQIAVLGSMELPANAQVARADVQFNYPENYYQLNPDNKALKLTANPLTASSEVTITEEEEDDYYTFTGTISNSLDEDVEGVNVIAVAYDDQGKVIGSSSTYVSVLSAKSSAKVEIKLMKTPAKPARVILFPSLPGNWGMN